MKLSEYIKSSLGTFSPNPDEWTLEQRLGLEWGKQAFTLEQTNADLLEMLEKIIDHIKANNPMGLLMRQMGDQAYEAIRKAKSHAGTLKGEGHED